MSGHRRERVAGELRDEIAQIVSRSLKDPRIGFVTVTRVEVSADLGHAKAFVSVLGDEKQRRESLAGLKQAQGFVRREVGRRVRMRVLPEIQFVYDKGVDATDRVARLLDEVRSGSREEGED
ncbi:MAG TPA: 30S ribosome-binding factor RbfA [Vicinamibacteria bacterium]|nr:30S ribosome-binding factor RbfA [Vicinamibacteria bacterium]